MLNLEDSKKAAENLLAQVLKSPANTLFRVSFKEDEGEGLLIMKRTVGSGEHVYAMYSPSEEDADITRNFLQLGIVANDKLYCMERSPLPPEIRKEFTALEDVIDFEEAYKKASSAEMEAEILKESRESVKYSDIPENIRIHYESNLKDFLHLYARAAYFAAFPHKPLLYERQGYLSQNDFAAVLCGQKDTAEVILKAAKSYRLETDLVCQAHVLAQDIARPDFTEAWELSLAEALVRARDKKCQSIMVSFETSDGGVTPHLKMEIKTVVAALASEYNFQQSDFEKWVKFPTPYGCPEIPKCRHIVSVKCKKEELYRKDGQEKETEDMELC